MQQLVQKSERPLTHGRPLSSHPEACILAYGPFEVLLQAPIA